MPFYDHLGSQKNICFPSCKSSKHLFVGMLSFCRIHIHSKYSGSWEFLMKRRFYLFCSKAKCRHMWTFTNRTLFCEHFFMPTIMTT